MTPDGRRCVSASLDQTLKVWDLADGESIATFTCDGAIYTCAIAADSRTIIAGDATGAVHFLYLELPGGG